MPEQHLQKGTADEPAREHGFNGSSRPPNPRCLDAEKFTINEVNPSESTIVSSSLLGMHKRVEIIDEYIPDLVAGPVDT